MQTKYQIEDFDGQKQISRFDERGNRIVVIKVESSDPDVELQFILDSLNYESQDGTLYQSPDPRKIFDYQGNLVATASI